MKLSIATQVEISMAFSMRLQNLKDCRALMPQEDTKSLAFWDERIAQMRAAQTEFDRARYGEITGEPSGS